MARGDLKGGAQEKLIRKLIEKGGRDLAVDRYGDNALHEYAKRGPPPKWLSDSILKQTVASVNCINVDGFSVLLTAINTDNEAFCEMLLRHPDLHVRGARDYNNGIASLTGSGTGIIPVYDSACQVLPAVAAKMRAHPNWHKELTISGMTKSAEKSVMGSTKVLMSEAARDERMDRSRIKKEFVAKRVEAESFRVGDMVETHSLQTSTFNGLEGEVVGLQDDRVQVKLSNGTQKALKPENLKRIVVATAKCPREVVVPEPPSEQYLECKVAAAAAWKEECQRRSAEAALAEAQEQERAKQKAVEEETIQKRIEEDNARARQLRAESRRITAQGDGAPLEEVSEDGSGDDAIEANGGNKIEEAAKSKRKLRKQRKQAELQAVAKKQTEAENVEATRQFLRDTAEGFVDREEKEYIVEVAPKRKTKKKKETKFAEPNKPAEDLLVGLWEAKLKY